MSSPATFSASTACGLDRNKGAQRKVTREQGELSQGRKGAREQGDKPRGYEGTATYQLAKRLAVEIHQMTLEVLPKFEMYEEGSQIKRFDYFYNQYRKPGAMLYNYREAAIQGRV